MGVVETIFGLGEYSVWQYISILFDNIPKIMYFLYAALASCLDAIQALLRKLIGLDPYYIGNTATNDDPVRSFIFGILGIGDKEGTYSVLGTVFWSMAIFGLIVLVVATIVAIIRSHYNEDSAKTSPVGYVYTALKSVFAFAVTPAAVIFGLWLSSFFLTTLDNITGQKATQQTLVGVYGSEATSKFQPASNGSYTHYDFFGFGTGATSQTFSGMLFKTCAYNANRVRNGWSSLYTYDGLFDNSYVPEGLGNESNATAYKIDYAFMNNLQVGGIWNAKVIYKDYTGPLLTIKEVDFFSVLGSPGFSKYNVGLVWHYYDLWQFNFLVGFLAGATLLVLFLKIVFGVMIRLIKCAAYFLIYPATLGLAPMDDFKAFKSWRGEFIQNILMAFGSIIGVNIFFLILPLLSNFSWFRISLLDGLVTILFLVTGLYVVNDFIKFMSGLIGGGDALSTGEGVAGKVKGGLQKGAGMTLGAANVAFKVAKFIPGVGSAVGLAGSAISTKIKKGQANKAAKNAAELDQDSRNFEAAMNGDLSIDDAKGLIRADYADSDKGKAAMKDIVARQKKINKHNAKVEKEGKGKKKEDLDFNAEMDKAMMKDDHYKQRMENAVNFEYSDEEGQKAVIESSKNASSQQTARATDIRSSIYRDKDGNKMPHAFRQKVANEWGKITGSLLKFASEAIPDYFGIKMSAIKDVMLKGTNYKVKDGEITGTYGTQNAAMGEAEYAEYKQKQKESRGMRRAAIGSALGSVFGYGNPVKPPPKKEKVEDVQRQAGEDMKSSAQAMLKISQQLADSVNKLNKASETMGKASTAISDAAKKFKAPTSGTSPKGK